jgi:ammonia channel protein AmtB
MLHYSRRHLCVAVLGAALPWRAWAGFNFCNSEYTATRSELQAMIAIRFPPSQRYAQIITVGLSDPQLD